MIDEIRAIVARMQVREEALLGARSTQAARDVDRYFTSI